MDRCFDTREIPTLTGLAADDPRRRHLEACPRCRALAQAYAEFLDPGDTSDLEDLSALDAELARRLDKTIAESPVLVIRRRRRRTWMAAAAVLAACALGLAAGELLRLREGILPSEGDHLRGEAVASGLVVTTTADGWILTWPDAPEFDLVVYVFLSDSLEEIGRRTATGELALAADDPLARAIFCQALAVAQGDTLARSAIVRLHPARE